jgi:hypothetical protein
MSSGCASVLPRAASARPVETIHARLISFLGGLPSSRPPLTRRRPDCSGMSDAIIRGGNFRKFPGIVGNFRKLSPDAVIRGACSRRAHAQSAHDNRQTAYVVWMRTLPIAQHSRCDHRDAADSESNPQKG